MLQDDLSAALTELAGLLAEAHQPWWVVGAAAVTLNGGEPGAFRRIEVVLSNGDLRRICELRGVEPVSRQGTPLTRSRRALSVPLGAYEAKLMVLLEVRQGGAWVPVQPRTRVAFGLAGGATVFAPDRNEMIALLHRYGRAKDLARAASLEALG